MIPKLDKWRHLIPFWWWLTYDGVVALVIVVGLKPSDPFYWIGLAVLAIATVIDLVEFVVKSPWGMAKLNG